MAGHARYTALLDANVLYPIAICDALMEVAITGIYAPKWTQLIDEEWIRNLAKDRNQSEEKFHIRRDRMHDACPDWEVPFEAWKALESSLNLPDPDDRHVLAAAIAGHADSIATMNLKDFPQETLDLFDITVLHPDDFLYQQLELQPYVVLPAFKEMRARLQNPEFTPAAFTDRLEQKYGLVQTASFLRDAQQLI